MALKQSLDFCFSVCIFKQYALRGTGSASAIWLPVAFVMLMFFADVVLEVTLQGWAASFC